MAIRECGSGVGAMGGVHLILSGVGVYVAVFLVSAFPEMLLPDFCMRCLLGVSNVVFRTNFVISSGNAGHSSFICTGGVSLIRGAGGSIIVDLRR